MKIGILTQPLHNNYGGLLQNYALQQVLKGIGHEPVTIDWNATSSLREKLWRIKQNNLFKLGFKGVKKPLYYPNRTDEAVISRNTDYFISKYISKTQTITSESEFSKVARGLNCGAFVVGSDQVWRPGYNGFPKAMFLDFTDGMKVIRIAYAASFGTSVWEFSAELTKDCARLAKKFDLITVREKSGLNLCREHFGVEATWVLDPTMLLNREDYEKVVFLEKEPKSEGTLFHYILDPNDEKKSLIEKVADEMNMKPFTIMPKYQAENRTKEDVKKRIEDCVFPSVTSWLRAFMDAEMVVVDSFHGAVFSIIFNKPFWVIANAERGNARFESLLGLYGLEDRMISPGDKVDFTKEIDWMRVNAIREREKKRCIDLLRNALN